jgi:hypothetical protein
VPADVVDRWSAPSYTGSYLNDPHILSVNPATIAARARASRSSSGSSSSGGWGGGWGGGSSFGGGGSGGGW